MSVKSGMLLTPAVEGFRRTRRHRILVAGRHAATNRRIAARDAREDLTIRQRDVGGQLSPRLNNCGLLAMNRWIQRSMNDVMPRFIYT